MLFRPHDLIVFSVFFAVIFRDLRDCVFLNMLSVFSKDTDIYINKFVVNEWCRQDEVDGRSGYFIFKKPQP